MASFLISSIIQVGLSLALSALNQPEDQTVEEGRINESRVTQSAMGTPILWGFGRVRAGGNLIWSGPITEVRTEREAGGKGFGGPSQTQVTYTYYGNFAVAVGRGEASALRRVWFDKAIWYDAAPAKTEITTNTSAGSVRAIKNEDASVRFYTGSETQEPDPLMVSFDGDFVPGYRGLCYVVFNNVNLTENGNRIPQIEIEVSYQDTPGIVEYSWLDTGFSIGGGQNDPMVNWSNSLRKIWCTSLLTMGVIDMDGLGNVSFPLDVSRDTTDPLFLRSHDEGGFSFPGETTDWGFRARANLFVFPNGRCHCPGDVRYTTTQIATKLAEFDPFTLRPINHGAWTPRVGSPQLAEGDFGGTTVTPSAQMTAWTNVGYVSGIMQVTATGVGISSPVTFNFYWTDNDEPQKSQSVTIPGNYGKISAMMQDRNGALWAFTYNRDTADTSPRGVAFKATISYDMGLIPGFADQVKVNVQTFDLGPYNINETVGVYYDLPSNSFLAISEPVNGESFYRLTVWDPDNEVVVRDNTTTLPTPTFNTLEIPFYQTKAGLSNGYAHLTGATVGGSYFRIDFVDLTVEVTAPTVGISQFWWHIPGQNVTWYNNLGDDWYAIQFDSLTEQEQTLDDVLGEIIDQIGIDSSTEATFDAGVQAQGVGGAQFPGTFSARQAIERLGSPTPSMWRRSMRGWASSHVGRRHQRPQSRSRSRATGAAGTSCLFRCSARRMWSCRCGWTWSTWIPSVSCSKGPRMLSGSEAPTPRLRLSSPSASSWGLR